MESYSNSSLYADLSVALARLDQQHLQLANEDLAYEILDQLDVEVISFMHSDSVNRLIHDGFLPPEAAEPIEDLRTQLMLLLAEQREVSNIRNSDEWVSARSLAGQIRSAFF